jgi:hypothetical protein
VTPQRGPKSEKLNVTSIAERSRCSVTGHKNLNFYFQCFLYLGDFDKNLMDVALCFTDQNVLMGVSFILHVI